MMKESHAWALAQVLTEPALELNEMLDTPSSLMRRGAYHQTIPPVSSLVLSARARLGPFSLILSLILWKLGSDVVYP